MEDLSKAVYEKYKTLNFFELLFGKGVIIVRGIVIFLLYDLLSNLFKMPEKYRYVFLFLLAIITILIMIFMFKKFKKKYANRLGNYKSKYIFGTLDHVVINILSDEIRQRGLFSKAGVEYLISIYSDKTKNNKGSLYALATTLLSAIIYSIVNLVVIGGDWKYIITGYYMLLQNSSTVIGLLIAICIVIFVIYQYYKLFIQLYEFLFGCRYASLVNALKNYILPMTLFGEDSTARSLAIRRQSHIRRLNKKL